MTWPRRLVRGESHARLIAGLSAMAARDDKYRPEIVATRVRGALNTPTHSLRKSEMGKPRKYFTERLAPVIAESFTWADVCRKLNLKPLTGSQSHLKKSAAALGIDFSHFQGKSYLGARKPRVSKPVEFYLTEYSTVNSATLRKRLIKSGLKEFRCEKCNNTEWLGQPTPLELHHINGVHDDCRLENLRIFCPNCHAVESLYPSGVMAAARVLETCP